MLGESETDNNLGLGFEAKNKRFRLIESNIMVV